jgi:hypothetical protein
MKGKRNLRIVLVILAVSLAMTTNLGFAQESPRQPEAVQLSLAGNAFTYQGYLTDGGSPANGTYDFVFSLYADLAGTQWVATAPALGDVPVADGVFTVQPDFTDPLYGDIHFYFNGEARYLKIGVRPGSSVSSYTYLTPLQALTPTPYAQALPGLHTIQNNTSPNVVGGYAWNSVNVNAVGAAIGGGGNETDRNVVNGNYGTVGGGAGNQADGLLSVIGGGSYNAATGTNATVAGGNNNRSGSYAFVGGGSINWATGTGSTIGGGGLNTAGGQNATIPGGLSNSAGGNRSFAAGYRAKANHDGSFVWADSTEADFASTATNRFEVRATGGTRFQANSSSYGMYVDNDGIGDGIRAYANTSSAAWAGVYAYNTGTGSGVFADTASGTYSGYFMDNIYVAGNCYGCTLAYLAFNGGGEPLEAGDLAAVGGVEDPLEGASVPVLRVQLAAAGDTVVGVVQSRAAISTGDREGQTLQSAERVAGAAAPGEYLFIVVSGLAQVKVDADVGAIVAGQRLTAANRVGHARTLHSRVLDGMEVAEGAPLVGIALAPLESGTGLIPVLVTLR